VNSAVEMPYTIPLTLP